MDPIQELLRHIRDVPDFPKKGIVFKDITPLLQNPRTFQMAVDLLSDQFVGKGVQVVVGAEARGFIIASPLAYKLGAGFVLVRKPGKLPWEKEKISYQLEYGTDALEIHRDAIRPGMKVLVADDLLATGGTAEACATLVEKMGGEVVGMAFFIELAFLKARERLGRYPITSLLQF
ncbi:MAG: adenine phosphoribosyltransferase [Candidatus Tectomicrobia bacterium]|uniref:Adenine phosphoribosyltransferase n=1 Tax=Tectimicrobiota bacterium TaxID=2528274 RepID=A0A932I5A5_UNCTE|nr:adenine phosphoribosyltransferase [Candidatus Tectomicrobia bacterium]